MKHLISIVFASVLLAMPAKAQVLDNLPEIEIPDVITDQMDKVEKALKEANRPDYSSLPPKAEREARLRDLFKRLRKEEDAADANLIAEEVWAIWLTSGSPSVDLTLRRGSAAQKAGDTELARRMYNHVMALSPDYAEGFARSGRLAYEQGDYNRAVVETTQALILEPRHFYALWTLGNILERLGKNDEALEAYRKANDIYPSLQILKDRVGSLDDEIAGDVL